MATFNPEDANRSLFKDGEANFRLIKATEEAAKSSGRAQFKFEFEVTDSNNKVGQLIEFCSLEPDWLWKLKKVCDAMGGELPALFASGTLTDGQINSKQRLGKFILRTQSDPKGIYDDKSVVAKFIKKDAALHHVSNINQDDEFHDDIPF